MTREEYVKWIASPPSDEELEKKLQRFNGVPMDVYIAICQRASVDPESNGLCLLVEGEKGHCLMFTHKVTEELGVHLFSSAWDCLGALMMMKMGGSALPESVKWRMVPLMILVLWDEDILQVYREGMLTLDKNIMLRSCVLDAGIITEDLTEADCYELMLKYKDRGTSVNIYLDGKIITQNEDESESSIDAATMCKLHDKALDFLHRSMTEGDDWKERIQ